MEGKRAQTILKRLGSGNSDQRDDALCDLRDLSTDEFVRQEQVYERQQNILALLTIAAVFVFLLTFLFLAELEAHGRELLGFLAIVEAVGLAPYLTVCWKRLNNVQRGLGEVRAERTIQIGDQGFKELTETLDALYKDLTSAYDQTSVPIERRYSTIFQTHREMLRRELTAISTEQARLLSSSQRRVMFSWVDNINFANPDLGLAALDALIKSEDPRATSSVKALANVPPATARMHRVRQFAGEQLKVLEARESEHRQETTLLRGSAPPAKPDMLLRPIHNSQTESSGGILLRAAHPESSSDREK